MGKKNTKRNSHRISCGRKVKHPSLEEAQQAAKLYENVEAYHCVWCKFWHTGHQWNSNRKKDY